MKLSVLPLLACPRDSSGKPCGGALFASDTPVFPQLRSPRDADELLEGMLSCSQCGLEFPVLSGVAVLMPDAVGYLRKYYRSVKRDLDRYGSLSATGRSWLERRCGREGGAEEYGADFRFSQQFERPADVAAAMVPEPERFYGRYLDGFREAGPYEVLAQWAGELPGERHLALDAGCGGGGLTARLSRVAGTALGIDLSLLAILLARRAMLHQPQPERSYMLNVRRGLEVERPLPGPPGGNLEFFVADACRLPFAGGLFDLTASCNVIDIVGLEGPLDEVARVTRAGGRVLLSDPFFWQEGKAPDGEPVAVLKEALARRGMEVLVERDGVPWAWATYDRHWRVYFNYCAAALRVGV